MATEAKFSGNFIQRGWRNIREAGTQRLAITAALLVVALLVARYSWLIPAVGEAERELYDARSFIEADFNEVEQDNRVTMIVYNDQTLIEARKRSPLDRGIMIETLRNLDQMGAKAIGIDILFDQPQDEDFELVETLQNMQTPTFIAYARTDSNDENIIYEQQLYLDEFAAALDGSNSSIASVRLSETGGVTRLWPEITSDLPPLLGRAMLTSAGEGDKTLPGYTGAVRYQLPADPSRPVFTTIPIDPFAIPNLAEIPDLAAEIVPSVEGRYILLGSDVVDIDRLTTPLSEASGSPEPPGVLFHATSIAQMLDGAALPKPKSVTLWLLALLAIIAGSLTALLEWKNWRVYPLMFAQFALFVCVPFLVHLRGVDTFGMPAFGWLIAWIVAFTAVTSAARASTAEQRQFAQAALGKYLPREMAQEILENPKLLALHGEKKQIYVLFSDLEGFTKMSHAISPEMVAKLLNRYLEMLSQVVLDHGGVIDKFVGDAVVAFWGAPIARDDDADRAAKAGYAIWQAGEAFRAEVAAMDESLPKIGKTRVGLHFGEAVVGNFGGDTRIQYTALGDSMNTAARLEAANKAMESSVMASREFADQTSVDFWRPMGRVVLRGRARPVDIMEPAPDFAAEDREKLRDAIILSETNNTGAITLLEEIISRHPDDTALANLRHRLKNVSEGNAYVLG